MSGVGLPDFVTCSDDELRGWLRKLAAAGVPIAERADPDRDVWVCLDPTKSLREVLEPYMFGEASVEGFLS